MQRTDAPGTEWPPGWWQPGFTAARVGALMTGRLGGCSRPPFHSFNLKPGIGDDDAAVQANRSLLHRRVGWPLVRVDQVHGVEVFTVTDAAAADPLGLLPRAVADACVTDRVGLACEIQVADCLPVLMADRNGRAVAAAHAGWRGLAGGVVEATLSRLCGLADAEPADIEVWLGPCIGPAAFEVGADVLAAFGCDAGLGGGAGSTSRFEPLAGVAPQGSKWWADLPGLARDRLKAAGVDSVGGNDGSCGWCTYTAVERCFSYRRSPLTGRMSALIWIDA